MSENLLSYTIVGTKISADSTTATATGLLFNETSRIGLDFGLDYFSDSAYLEGEFVATAVTGATAAELAFAFTDTDAPRIGTQNGAFFRMFHGTGWTCGVVELNNTVGTAFSSFAPVLGTIYYYRAGFFSSLGQFGAITLELYSNSTRVTHIATLLLQRTAARAYRYFYPIIGANSTASADSIDGSNANITKFIPTPGVNLTLAVETDASARLVPYANVVSATTLNISSASNAATHIAQDDGAGYYTDYKLSGVLNITAFATPLAGARMFNILSVTNGAADALAALDLQGISIKCSSSTAYTCSIHQAAGGVDSYSADSVGLSTSKPYSLTLERVGATVTLKIWNDVILINHVGTSQVGTTVTLTSATTAYRYLMPVTTSLNGATSRSSTFTIGGVKRTSASTPVDLIATESAMTGDSAATTALVVATATETTVTGEAATRTETISVGAIDTAIITDSTDATGFTPGATDGYESAATNDSATAVAADHSTQVAAAEITTTSDFSTAVATVAVYSKRYWRLVKYDATVAKDVPVTGLVVTPKYKLMNADSGLTRDFGDTINLFKDAATCVDYTADFMEKDATHWQGVYFYPLRVDALPNGRYVELAEAPDTPGFFTEVAEFYVLNGKIVDVSFEQIAAIPTNPLLTTDPRIDTIESIYTEMVRVTGNAGGLTFEQWKLTLVALPTAEENAAAVWADVNAIKMIKLGTNKHVLNPADGTVTIYDNDGTTVIYAGLAYMDAAGTQLYNGTSSVHHTTRLL